MKTSMRNAMFFFRVLFLAALMVALVQHQWNIALFYGITFAMTLFIPYFGRKEPHYYAIDIALSILFTCAIMVTWFSTWPDYHTIYSYDKLFHAAAGGIIAGFAAIYARQHIKNRFVFYIAIISFALAVGAAWEVFEWIISLLPGSLSIPNTGLADGMMDMVADTMGALVVAGILAYRRYL